MKKILSTLGLACFVSTSLTVGAFANNTANGPKKYDLRPTKDSEIAADIFHTFVYTEDNGNVVIQVKGHKDAGEALKAYHIQIDTKKHTYKISKVKGDKLKQFEEKFIKMKNASNKVLGDKTNLAAATNYTAGVIATTDDPVGADLCESKHQLTWAADGTTAKYVSRTKSAWAANPSAFDTHWYVDSDKYTALSTIDGGRTVHSSSYAAYHNYDFLDNSKRTDVTHSLTIDGYKTGGFDYYVDWTRSGEASDLLDLDIATY